MGTPLFAVPILKSLYQNGYPISVVYTQPPQKSKRGQKINKSPVQGIAETLNIDFRSPITLKNNQEEYKFLKERQISGDLIFFDDVTQKKFPGVVKAIEQIKKDGDYSIKFLDFSKNRAYALAMKL